MINFIIVKVLGKERFKLSKEVPLSYIMMLGQKFIFGLVRGKLRTVTLKKKGKNVIVGKKVAIRVKKHISIGNNVRLDDRVILDGLSTEGITLGDRVKIGADSKILCTGSLENLGKGIEIGENSSFAENTFFGAAGGIKIGQNVISGQNVRFHSENHKFADLDVLIREQGVTRKGIKVGDNCWIGSGVVFLDGSEVGSGCVIAANAVVSGKFSSNEIIGGMPAKKLKTRGEKSE
ncbi:MULTISPECIES: acyltransferase [unclassified Enterococcus]|uniref:acyltransferase n=1 Tax=unclassified Enterococcus TaxID=2608891 RepID=UPI001CE05463|nr:MULTISPECIES: acyltransferase [unclassified Enterococcus]MCA5014095.1 acyltransferase [Enterococcus sp. S23]MCA5017131.1 acyltransferase [Enterococcus sp. S22(2020)]